MTRQGKTVKSRFFGTVHILTGEEELKVVKTIQEGKKFLGVNQDELSPKEKKIARQSRKAIQKLLESYSPLIEKIVRENYSPTMCYITPEEMFSEAMTIATQCARNFDPHKGTKRVLRFSAYVSRPVASAMYRMATRSSNVVSMPVDTVIRAKKWTHPLYDMGKKGITISDEEISKITGIDMTQQEAAYILDNRAGQTMDKIPHPGVMDAPPSDIQGGEDMRNILVQCIHECVPYADAVCSALGLTNDGHAIFSDFVLSASVENLGREDAQKILDLLPTYLTHPVYRMRLREKLQEKIW